MCKTHLWLSGLLLISAAFRNEAVAANLIELFVPGLTNTVATSMNSHGVIVGYGDGSSGTVGFVDSGGSFAFLAAPGSTATFANGINDAGDIVGWYSDSTGNHGFKYSDGVYTTIDAPSPAVPNSTMLVAINNLGQIAGNAHVSSCPIAGNLPFVDSGGSFAFVPVPCGDSIAVAGMNDSGELVGTFSGIQIQTAPAYGTVSGMNQVSGTGGSGFTAINNHTHVVLTGNNGSTYILSSPTDQNRSVVVAFPGAASTMVRGLTDADMLVGNWTDSSAHTHAFTGAAGPPPTCTITGSAGTRQLTFTVQDTGSGLSQIVPGTTSNANLVIPSFAPGTTSPVFVTATASDSSQNAVAGITITNTAGTSTSCSSRIYAAPPHFTYLGGILIGNVAVGTNVDGSLEAFGIGTDGQLWHIAQSGGPGGAWGPWQALSGASQRLAGDPVVVADSDGLLQVFTISTANQPFVIGQVAPGNWFNASWRQLPSSGVQGRASGVWGGGALVYARAGDNSVQAFGKSLTGWVEGNNLGGVIIGDPSAAVDADKGTHILAIGTDNTLWEYTIASSGVIPWTSLGGSFQGDPEAISSGGTLYVFARGTDNALWVNSRMTGGSWAGWQSLGGILIDNPKATVNSDGRVEVFVVGTDNAVWHKAQFNAGGTQWSDWTSPGGIILGDVFPVVDTGSILNLFVVGGNQGVYQMTQSVPDTWE